MYPYCKLKAASEVPFENNWKIMSNYEKRCILFLSLIVTQSLFCRPQASQQRPTVNAKPKYTKDTFPQKTRRLLNLYWKEFLVSCGIVGIIVWKLRRGANSTSTGKNIADASALQPKFDPENGPYSPDQKENPPHGLSLLCTFYARASAWVVARNAMAGKSYDTEDANKLARQIVEQTFQYQQQQINSLEIEKQQLTVQLQAVTQSSEGALQALNNYWAKKSSLLGHHCGEVVDWLSDEELVVLSKTDQDGLKQLNCLFVAYVGQADVSEAYNNYMNCCGKLTVLQQFGLHRRDGSSHDMHILTDEQQKEWAQLPIVKLYFPVDGKSISHEHLTKIKSANRGAFIVNRGEHSICIDYDAKRVDVNGQPFPFVMRDSLQPKNPNPPGEIVDALKKLL